MYETYQTENYAPVSMLKDPVVVKPEGFNFEIDSSEQGDCEEMKWNDKLVQDNCRLPDEEGDGDAPFASLVLEMTNVTADGGVKKKLIKAGTGPVVPTNAFVTVHYSGFLNDLSDEPFDSTSLRGEPQKFFLGDEADVTRGLVEAVRTMSKGEISKFVFTPEYFLGVSGVPPRVPPNATVMFEVTLQDFVEASPEAAAYYSLPVSERALLPLNVIASVANMERNEASAKFRLKRYGDCIRHYTRAIRALERCRLENDQDEQEQKKMLITFYNNMAVCNLQMDNLKQAISFADQTFHIDNKNTKALFLKSKALRKQGKLCEAKETLCLAQKLEPFNSDINKELIEIDKCEQNEKKREKQMYAKMCSDMQSALDSSTETQNSNNVSTCSKEFEQQTESFMREFIADGERREMKIPVQHMTEADIKFIKTKAKQLALYAMSERQSDSQILVLRKKN